MMTHTAQDTPASPAFSCQRCNECCMGQGGIFFEEEQVGPAAEELGLSREEFTRRYLASKDGRWEVLCGDDGACRLLGPQGCMVQQVKPDICARWPFFPALVNDAGAFEEAKLACPGLNPQASHQDFLAQFRATKGCIK